MTDAITDNRKKRGRPAVGSTLVGVRLPPAQVERLDGWISEQPEVMSRPEALRRLAELGLAAEDEKDAEKA